MTSISQNRTQSSIESIGYPEIVTTESFNSYVQSKRRVGDIIDLAHSNTSKERQLKFSSFVRTLMHERDPAFILSYYTENEVPRDLLKLGHKAIFSNMAGLEGTDENNVAIAPQTSTLLNKTILKVLNAQQALNNGHTSPVVALYPSGNFRFNNFNPSFTDVASRNVAVDPVTKRITPETLSEAIAQCEARGEKILSLILETPSNPFMAIYPVQLMREIAKITEEHGIFVINDMYLSGTESLEVKQSTFASVATRQDLVATTYSMRRCFDVDRLGRVGFMCSHNKGLVASVQKSVKSSNFEYTVGDLIIAAEKLRNHDPADLQLRIELATARGHAESIVDSRSNLRVIVQSNAGPFITIGFSQEMEDKFINAGITDGYKLAAYIAETTKVLAIPLCDMSSTELGFRINVAHDWETTIHGINALNNVSDFIDKGIRFADIKPALDQTYNNANEIESTHFHNMLATGGRAGI